MARLVTLHDTDGEIIYPQSIPDPIRVAELSAQTTVAAYGTVLSLTLPAGKWKVTTEVGGFLSLTQNASGGFTHCGLKTTICMVQVGGYVRPHETFIDIVEPTAQTTYTLSADFGMTYKTETKMVAERVV
jgi:hypothetical protein